MGQDSSEQNPKVTARSLAQESFQNKSVMSTRLMQTGCLVNTQIGALGPPSSRASASSQEVYDPLLANQSALT